MTLTREEWRALKRAIHMFCADNGRNTKEAERTLADNLLKRFHAELKLPKGATL